MVKELERILAVIVLYKIKLEKSKTFLSLTKSLSKENYLLDLFVYDNSPLSNSPSKTYQNWNIRYLHDSSNSGVSIAYNTAARFAQNQGKNWILLLDQDTHFPINAMKEYLFSINKFHEHFIHAPQLISNGKIVSPCRYKFKRGFHLKSINSGINAFKNKTIVNSGALLHLDLFFKAQMYNPNIKLDFSDFDFFERVKREVDEFILLETTCQHDFSANATASLQSVLNRYFFYCEGGRFFAKSFMDHTILIGVTLLRGIKLSFKFRNIGFLKIFLSNWFKNV